MKKTFLTLAASLLVLSSMATDKKDYSSKFPAWFIEVNMNTGALDQRYTMYDFAQHYPTPVNNEVGNVTFSNGKTFGVNGQVGYFFGQQRHFGIGAGLMYFSRSGHTRLSSFHTEYKATDYKNDVFRQLITAKQPIIEKLDFTSISVPLVIKFQHKIGKRWAITADAGVVYNIQNKYTYNTTATFDYEAIYKFVQSGNSVTAVYDASPVPGKENWLITKAAFNDKNPDGDVNAYFEAQAATGYSVGLNKSTSQTGSFSYKTGALGFIVQPAVSFMATDKLALDLGVYYMSQTFSNDEDKNYQLADNKGTLNTILEAVKTNTTTSYGCTFGLRLYFGK